MAQTKVLVVDDDPAVRNLVHRYLANQGYEVESAADGESALERFDQFNPNLVVLDVNLPDVTGYRLCQAMRERTNAFILMLTCRTDEVDIIDGYKYGAKAYVTKPFSLGVLEAQIKALTDIPVDTLVQGTAKVLTFNGGLSIDPVRCEVTRNNKLVSLTALEFNLLHFFAKNPGRVWSREELLQKVWNYTFEGGERVVDVHVGQLRKKIEDDTSNPQFIHTVRRRGYKFEPPKPMQAHEAS